jgi:hypothetical protein
MVGGRREGLVVRRLAHVEGENASGATRLYESVGMRPRRSWRWYEKEIVRD